MRGEVGVEVLGLGVRGRRRDGRVRGRVRVIVRVQG